MYEVTLQILIVFGIPLLGYILWRRFFVSKLRFLFLMLFLVMLTWLAISVEYAVSLPADKEFSPFYVLGWFGAVVGCLPVIIIDAVISVCQWWRNRRVKK